MSSRRLPPWWLVCLLAVMAFAHAAQYGARLFLAYRTLDLGGGPFEVGVIAAAYAAVSFLVAIPVGRLVDRRGGVAFLVLGCVILAVVPMALVIANSLVELFVAHAAIGFGQLLLAVGSQAYLANHPPVEGREGRFGLYAAAAAIGQAAGPAVGGVAAASLPTFGPMPYTASFAAAAVFGLCATLFASFLLTDRRIAPSPISTEEGGGAVLLDLLRNGTVLQAMLASIAVLLSVDLLVAYLPVLGEERGIPVEIVGLLLALRAAASVVSRLFMGALLRTWGVGRLLWRSMVVPAMLMGILPFVGGHEAIFAIMILLGIGLGMGQPLSLAWITAIVPPGNRGMAVGLRLSGNRLGQLVAPPVLGAIGGVAGVASIFLFLAALLGVAAVVVVASPLMSTGLEWHEDRKHAAPPSSQDGTADELNG